MSETMHDEKTPLKNLSLNFKSVALIFPLAVGCGMAWHGAAPCSYRKECLGPERDLWMANHNAHCAQEVRPGLGPR